MHHFRVPPHQPCHPLSRKIISGYIGRKEKVREEARALPAAADVEKWTVAPVEPDQMPQIRETALASKLSKAKETNKRNRSKTFQKYKDLAMEEEAKRIFELFDYSVEQEDEKILKRSNAALGHQQQHSVRHEGNHHHLHHRRRHRGGGSASGSAAGSSSAAAGSASSHLDSANDKSGHAFAKDGLAEQYDSAQPLGSGFLGVCASIMVKEKLTETFDADGNLVSIIQRPGQQQEIYYEKCLKAEVKCAGIDEVRFDSKCEQDFGFTQMLFRRHGEDGKATGPTLWGFVRVPRSCSCKIHRKQSAADLFVKHSSSSLLY
ncbi:unnamed protein product [Notodromas monacha]|uniref:Spaetzle domain-containing protein n=1 Tax=Notodromas monacha TaxID=399045 RepID=A0A7R9GC04_9CRUS|nr:unnamed protein product [Notodromas monacha]CAG0917088.1 unnamed protein product [Notodromas monacha]